MKSTVYRVTAHNAIVASATRREQETPAHAYQPWHSTTSPVAFSSCDTNSTCFGYSIRDTTAYVYSRAAACYCNAHAHDECILQRPVLCSTATILSMSSQCAMTW
eukprot:15377-Heterococcus_DN1.PRE.5